MQDQSLSNLHFYFHNLYKKTNGYKKALVKNSFKSFAISSRKGGFGVNKITYILLQSCHICKERDSSCMHKDIWYPFHDGFSYALMRLFYCFGNLRTSLILICSYEFLIDCRKSIWRHHADSVDTFPSYLKCVKLWIHSRKSTKISQLQWACWYGFRITEQVLYFLYL